MRRLCAIAVAALLYYSGVVPLAVWCGRLSRRRLIILNYHSAMGGDLRRHLLYLRRHYRVLHLEEALEELYGTPTNRRDRRTALVITFDDGHTDNYVYAFELARVLRVPITIFATTGYIESRENFWWLEGKRLVDHTRLEKVMLKGLTYHLGEPRARRVLEQLIHDRLRNAISVAERDAFLGELRRALAAPLAYSPEEELLLPMSWGQVREMEESGWVSFGAHTVNHPVLSCLLDPREVRREVSQSRVVLEEKLGHPVRSFAYPIGKPEDIGEGALRAVREAGYSWAVTSVSGANTPGRDPYQLLRLSSNASNHWLVQAAVTAGVWKLVSPKWRKTYRTPN